jgi:DNA-binding response OmpR family regulator
MSILIVGDPKHATQSLAALLRASLSQCEIRRAGDAGEAVRIAGETRPRLVILDVREADLQTLSTAREIRSRFADTRVLVLTLNSSELQAEPAGWADAIVSKNASPDELLMTLSSLLDQPSEQAGPPRGLAGCGCAAGSAGVPL